MINYWNISAWKTFVREFWTFIAAETWKIFIKILLSENFCKLLPQFLSRIATNSFYEQCGKLLEIYQENEKREWKDFTKLNFFLAFLFSSTPSLFFPHQTREKHDRNTLFFFFQFTVKIRVKKRKWDSKMWKKKT